MLRPRYSHTTNTKVLKRYNLATRYSIPRPLCRFPYPSKRGGKICPDPRLWFVWLSSHFALEYFAYRSDKFSHSRKELRESELHIKSIWNATWSSPPKVTIRWNSLAKAVRLVYSVTRLIIAQLERTRDMGDGGKVRPPKERAIILLCIENFLIYA